MTDVCIFNTSDGGDISLDADDSGLASAFYLSMFGGNPNWWGNIGEEIKYIGRTEEVLKGLPATSSNLARLREAVLEDAQFLIDCGAAESISVTVSIPSRGIAKITAVISSGKNIQTVEFLENWQRADYS